MRDLDSIISDLSIRSTNPIGIMDGATFFAGMKKMAEEGMTDPATGAMAGPFTVPLPQAVELIAAMVSNEFKTQVYYIFYANMLRGLAHEGIAEEFMDHAQDELNHATYLLRRMSVLSPGGITIPPYAPPEPMTDPTEIVKTMIVVEQIGLSLWKQLHSIMGDNPMKYTIEQFLQAEEEHQDELWQLIDAMPMPEMPGMDQGAEPTPGAAPAEEPAKTQVKVETSAPQLAAEPKVASIFTAAMSRKQASSKDSLLASLALATKANNTAEASKLREQLKTEHSMDFDKKAAIASVEQLQNWVQRARLQADEIHAKNERRVVPDPKFTNSNDDRPVLKNNKFASLSDLVKRAHGMEIPPPGMDTPEMYVEREQQLSAQQAVAEAAHAKTIAMQATQAAQQAQAEAQASQEQLQAAQQQVEQLSQQATQESQQSLVATQQAAEAEARAADHSIAKMQLGMRVNQLRQELANMVMQDPVAESAATVSDLAAQGMPATPMQQQQAEQQAQAGPEGPPSAEAQEQVQEAETAQNDAQQQTQQAEQAVQEDKSKGGKGGPGTTVQVKTSEMNTVVQRAGSARGPVGAAAQAPGVLQGLVNKARPYAPHIAAGVAGAGLLAGGVALARHAHNVGQSQKTASPADRRMAREILEGAEGPLNNSLIAMLRKHAPGAAGVAGAEKAMADAGKAVQDVDVDQLHALGAKLRPHAPGFAVGLGAGILGHKTMSKDDARQQMQPPSYYVQ